MANTRSFLSGSRALNLLGRCLTKKRTWLQTVSVQLSGAQFSTSSSRSSDKVYELRTYSINAKDMKQFLDLGAEHMHLRTAHSKLVGYWTSEIGGLNDVVHFWEYDNLSHRAKVRAALAADPNWIGSYFSKVLPMLQRQDNALLRCLPGTTVQESPAKGVYELQQFCFPGQEPKDVVDHVQSMKKPGATLLGSFYNIIGPLSGEMGSLLWYHPDIDNVLASPSCQSKDVKIVHSRLLSPTAWSNMK